MQNGFAAVKFYFVQTRYFSIFFPIHLISDEFLHLTVCYFIGDFKDAIWVYIIKCYSFFEKKRKKSFSMHSDVFIVQRQQI